MPTFNMLPNGVTGTNNWLANGFPPSACTAAHVDDDNGDKGFFDGESCNICEDNYYPNIDICTKNEY